jgi:hypothetical protein
LLIAAPILQYNLPLSIRELTSCLSRIVFHRHSHTSSTANAEVDTVKVLVKLALLKEDPETISSEVSKVPF